jgi:hypothetical protein
MEGIPATYLGRIVSKKNFRAFIYGENGVSKLVNSWDEFEAHMATGIWFALKEDAVNRIPVEKPKRVKKENVRTLEFNKDDGFLPKE